MKSMIQMVAVLSLLCGLAGFSLLGTEGEFHAAADSLRHAGLGIESGALGLDAERSRAEGSSFPAGRQGVCSRRNSCSPWKRKDYCREHGPGAGVLRAG